MLYTEQMDAAGLGDRLPEVTQKPFLSQGSLSLQCRHWESFCEMQTQYPQSAFQGSSGGPQRRSAAVCDPNPPRPFARYRYAVAILSFGTLFSLCNCTCPIFWDLLKYVVAAFETIAMIYCMQAQWEREARKSLWERERGRLETRD